MITKELRESAVELNVIFENCSEEVLVKIPNKFRKFLEKIESKTYTFTYDSTKSLNEQKLKPKTRRLLSLIYSDYLCTEKEKQQYLKRLNNFFEEETRLKYEKYNPDNIFKKERKTIEKSSNNELVVESQKNTIIIKIIKFFKKIINR